MTIEEFINRISIIGSPIEPPTQADWARLERDFMQLPPDLKAYLSRFGTGILADFFVIWNPFTQCEGAGWKKGVEQSCAAISENYRQPENLLPFGHTMNGDTLFWITLGEMAEWRVAVGREEPILKSGDFLPVFLFRSLTSRQYSAVLPDLTSAPRTFRPLNC